MRRRRIHPAHRLIGAVGAFLAGWSAAVHAADSRYVADAQCTPCHAEIARDFPTIGMARAFGPPDRSVALEDWSLATFEHAASGDHYRMAWRDDGRLWFERWRVDRKSAAVHRFETPVAYALGSGNRSRTYLYRAPSGELFQLPLAWYAQEKRFAMAPGYDRPDHEGVTRRVRRECLFCHDAAPTSDTVAPGWDQRFAPQVFPAELPHGIGCQRCHGPGSEHVRVAWTGVAPPAEIRAAIVQPARLDPPRAREVCSQCHLQPSVAVPGLRRLGRGDYAFRPGESLDDSILAVEALNADADGTPQTDRFEINHHAHRLEGSRCFAASPESETGRGRLACFRCHDPHRKLPKAELVARVRNVCVACHEPGRCPKVPAAESASADCASCHMPERRPRDVVHVTMTDHRIQKNPAQADVRLAPLNEEDPILLDLRLRDTAPVGPDADLYRALAVVRSQGGASPAAVDRLLTLTNKRQPPETELALDLAQGLLLTRRPAEAEEILRQVLTREPENAQATEWLGLTLAGQGRWIESSTVLRPLADDNPPRPEALYNLGLALRQIGRPEEAVNLLERVVALRPNQALAWYHLALARRAAGREGVGEALERALAVDPAMDRAVKELAANR